MRGCIYNHCACTTIVMDEIVNIETADVACSTTNKT